MAKEAKEDGNMFIPMIREREDGSEEGSLSASVAIKWKQDYRHIYLTVD